MFTWEGALIKQNLCLSSQLQRISGCEVEELDTSLRICHDVACKQKHQVKITNTYVKLWLLG